MTATEMGRAEKRARLTDILGFLDKLAYEEGLILSGKVKSTKRIEAQRRRWIVARLILEGSWATDLLKKISFYARTEQERKVMTDAQIRKLGWERNPMSPEAIHYREQKQRERFRSMPKCYPHKPQK